MARIPTGSISSFIILPIFIFFFYVAADRTPNHFSSVLSPATLGFKKEKLSRHLHFYFHDTIRSPNTTAIRVVSGALTNTSVAAAGFGDIFIGDDPLTEGPEISSKLVGRAQGMYADAAQDELGLLMVMSFVFMEGKYNGSTLSVLGRNKVLSEVREMPVVGGSGLFRFARGYAQAKTYSVNFRTATVAYNVFVIHY